MKNPFKRSPSVSRVLKALEVTIAQLDELSIKAMNRRSANVNKIAKLEVQNGALDVEIDHALRVSKKLTDLVA